MDSKLLPTLVLAICTFSFAGASGQEESRVAKDDLRAEIQALRQAVTELADQVQALEERLAKLEAGSTDREQLDRSRPQRIRRLRRYILDENGIIWNGNHPVGVWGVDGVDAPARR
jgi:uncharacterized protein YlxW (UPF0749 family)